MAWYCRNCFNADNVKDVKDGNKTKHVITYKSWIRFKHVRKCNKCGYKNLG